MVFGQPTLSPRGCEIRFGFLRDNVQENNFSHFKGVSVMVECKVVDSISLMFPPAILYKWYARRD